MKMVRGSRDKIFIKLAKIFNSLVEEFNEPPVKFLETTPDESLKLESVLIVETHSSDPGGNDILEKMGSAFYIESIGIITCAHVVSDRNNLIDKPIYIFTSSDTTDKYECEIKLIDNNRDLAVLKPIRDNIFEHITSFRVSDASIVLQQDIKILGYPAYSIGQSCFISDARIAVIYNTHGISKFETSCSIREGNSGGPVLNSKNEVIGIVAEGAEKGYGKNAAVNITELLKIIEGLQL